MHTGSAKPEFKSTVDGQVLIRLKEGSSFTEVQERWEREIKEDELAESVSLDHAEVERAEINSVQPARKAVRYQQPVRVKKLIASERKLKATKQKNQTVEGDLNGAASKKKKANETLREIVLLDYEAEPDIERLIQDLKQDPDVELAEPNYVYRLKYTPNDEKFPSQWGHTQINLPATWDITASTRGSGQVVAVLDTGCDITHEDLAGSIWTNPGEIAGNGIDDDGNGYVDDIHGWSIINNSPSQLNDTVGHGTHVAGIIAATTNNTTGIAGVAPNAKVMVVKVFQADGTASLSDLVEAVDYAYFSGATVINMSFGGPQSQFMEDSLARAYSQAVLVASAGNEWSGTPEPPPPLFPASLDYVISVGASNQSGKSTTFSNWGEVYAPGAGILSTLPGNDYKSWSGTSMAAPYVSGLAALYRAHHPAKSIDITSAQLIQGNQQFAANPNPFSQFSILGPRLDAMDVFTSPSQPNVEVLSYEITDPAPGGNGDGIPDVGETVLVNVTLKNRWDTASDVQATLSALDATNSSVSIGLSHFGSIGAFATKDSTATGATQFEVAIDSNAAHGLILPFELSLTYDGLLTAKTQIIHIEANRATTISGHINQNLTWTNDRLWHVTESALLNEGYTLTIEPGTKVVIDSGATFNAEGSVEAIGTKEQWIEITGNMLLTGDNNTLKYIRYNGTLNGGLYDGYDTRIEHSYFSGSNHHHPMTFNDVNFIGNTVNGGSLTLVGIGGGSQTYQNNLFMNNDPFSSSPLYGALRLGSATSDVYFNDNIFINNLYHASTNAPTSFHFDLSDNYFFEDSYEDLSEHIYDRFDAAVATIQLPSVLPQPISDISALAPPVVSQIQFHQAQPVSSGDVIVSIIFNKSMDTSTSPTVTYGAKEPYTQRAFSGGWINSTRWDGTAQVDRYVSDGINKIRVADTRDAAHYMPLVAYTWGEFEISTAGLLALGLQANSGPGTVELSWLGLSDERSVGVNIYRSTSSGGPYQKINPSIVTDTSYTDAAVTQGTTYYYITRDVTASLEESPDSSEISAVPGDATPPNISHTPPVTPILGSEPYVVATITDNIEVTAAFLHYRIGQSGDFQQLAMGNTSGSLWRAQLPAATEAGYSYYIQALDGVNSTLWQSAQAPYALAVSGAPIAELSATPLSGNTPLLVQFTDLSIGGATAWQWDFDNDGNIDSTQRHPSYIYNQPGTYSVRQIVSNASGSHSEVKTSYIQVYGDLNCVFTADKRAGAAPLSVQFTDQSSGNPQQWAWDFDGDGNIDSSAQNPSYSYSSAGMYTVSLTISSPNSTDSATQTAYIAVYSDATTPQPNFVADISTGTPGSNVTFSDLSAGGGTAWEWDFNGDGVTDSIEQNPTYVFNQPGKFDVSLKVTNANGTTEIIKPGLVLIYDTSIAYQGRLRMNGEKANAAFPMQFSLFEQASGGDELWTESHPSVSVSNGLFTVYLGDINPISQNLLDESSALYLEVSVYDDATEQWHTLAPRFRLSNTIRSRQIVR